MNTKQTWIKILAMTIIAGASMSLYAASSKPDNKDRSMSISGTGGIATRAFTGVWNQPTPENKGTVIQIVDSDDGGLDAIVYWFDFDDSGIPIWYYADGPVIDNRIELTIYEATDPAFLSASGAQKGKLQALGNGTIEFDNCFSGTFSGVTSISGTGGFRSKLNKTAGVANTDCAGGTSDSINSSDSPVDIRSFFTAMPMGVGSSGKAEFEISGGRTNFEVEIEDLPVGKYGLSIDGNHEGDIQVTTQTSGGTKGEIEFRSPLEPGKVLLTFDPRGKSVDVINSSSLVVLTQIFPTEAPTGTGGLPGGTELELDIDMNNMGIYPDGDAKAEFEQRPDRTEFSVELEDIPVGSYDLFVGKVFRGSISVIDINGGTEGEIEFRNPVEAGKTLLDFDPRDQLIEVMEGSMVLFSSILTSKTPPPSGSFNLELELENAGVDLAAEGDLLYKKFGNRVRIEIEVEELTADGLYKIFINDTPRANLQVEDGKGRWGFRTADLSKGPFPDGDPTGAEVSIRFDGVEILFVTIP